MPPTNSLPKPKLEAERDTWGTAAEDIAPPPQPLSRPHPHSASRRYPLIPFSRKNVFEDGSDEQAQAETKVHYLQQTPLSMSCLRVRRAIRLQTPLRGFEF